LLFVVIESFIAAFEFIVSAGILVSSPIVFTKLAVLSDSLDKLFEIIVTPSPYPVPIMT